MKLRLSNEGKVSILDVSEDMAASAVPVLKAGVTKLLQSGKDKIIINTTDAKQVSSETIIEILKLNQAATELKGQIVLVGHGDIVKQAIQGAPELTAIKYFSTREAALNSLSGKDEPQKSDAKAKSNIPDPLDELKSKVAALEAENKTLKGQIANRSADDARKSKADAASLQSQVVALEEQVLNLTKDRKKPFDGASYDAKIAQLEQALGDALGKESAVAKK